MTQVEKRQLIESTKAVIERLRREYGQGICTDAVLDGDIMAYTIMPNDMSGYTREIDLVTGKSRHCGNGKGCLWTDWE